MYILKNSLIGSVGYFPYSDEEGLSLLKSELNFACYHALQIPKVDFLNVLLFQEALMSFQKVVDQWGAFELFEVVVLEVLLSQHQQLEKATCRDRV